MLLWLAMYVLILFCLKTWYKCFKLGCITSVVSITHLKTLRNPKPTKKSQEMFWLSNEKITKYKHKEQQGSMTPEYRMIQKYSAPIALKRYG